MNLKEIKNIKLGNSDIYAMYFQDVKVWPLCNPTIIPSDSSGFYYVNNNNGEITDCEYDFSNVKSISFGRSISAYPNGKVGSGGNTTSDAVRFPASINSSDSKCYPTKALQTCISINNYTQNFSITSENIENICIADYYTTSTGTDIGEMSVHNIPSKLVKFELYGKNPLKKITFKRCKNLEEVYFETINSLESGRGLFLGCDALTKIPFINVSEATDLSYMFGSCNSLKNIDISVGQPTNTMGMFSGCTLLEEIPLFDTSKVVDMSYMFNECRSLREVPLLNCESVKNAEGILFRTAGLIKGFKDLGKAFTDEDILSHYNNVMLEDYVDRTNNSLDNIIDNLYDMNLTNVTVTPKIAVGLSITNEQISRLRSKGWDCSIFI